MALIVADEAFGTQSLAMDREIGGTFFEANVNGGAVALGHLVEALGARIPAPLLRETAKRGAGERVGNTVYWRRPGVGDPWRTALIPA